MPAAPARTVKQWMEETAGLASGYYREFPFSLPPQPRQPKGLEVAHPAFGRCRFRRLPVPFAAAIEDGAFRGERGVIFAPDGTLLQDVSAANEMRALGVWPRAERLSGTVAPLAFKFVNNYFHWMMDVLPRLLPLRLSGWPIDRYIISPQGPYPYVETLRLLGISEEKLLIAYSGSHWQADRLVVVPNVSRKELYPRWSFDFLRGAFARSVPEGQPDGPSYVYISRAGALKRKIVNEEEVASLLKRHGFHIAQLEGMPLTEQIGLFRSAHTIVAPHGAGLTNLLFSPQGVRLIELFSPNYVKPYYWVLSSYLDADYYCLIGESSGLPDPERPPDRRDDIVVDVGKLTRLLHKAGIR
ncbi:DUF563 domain-containing protein [Paenibacillus hodogayensis]|uniref:DUF563 domain-containing protein n=1 Tax=Paenibacillus hodogayensis TaxID=279208 RepID=A0ABV5VTR4_9BACL